MSNSYIMVTTEPLVITNKSNNSSFVLPKDTPIYKSKNQKEYYIFIDYAGRHISEKATSGSNLSAIAPSQNPKNKQINFNRDNYSKAELELILKRSSLTKQEIIEVIESL